ncbi:MAG: sulfatase-like hydrolase/transferase, partial [Phycisphaeraceae bacterium]|nr:sulfatase-like hydrolase/transferase [Phycisphaeraceae bacterium]
MDAGRRSVLLIIADDWSPIAGCYGDRVIRTPHIDAVARRGVTFDHAYCTSPSCAASRANLLTGLYTHTHGQYGHSHGIHGFRTHEHVKSLPGVLGEAGARSGCIGKTHFAPASVYPFDVMDGSDSLSAKMLAGSVGKFLGETGDRAFYLHVAPTFPHRHEVGYGAEEHAEEYAPLPTYDPAMVPVPGWLPDEIEVRRDLAGYYQAVSRFDA